LGDSLDLTRFHDLVCAEAGRMKRLGDTDTLGQRKAKAPGVIADRDQPMLDLDAADASTAGHSAPTGTRRSNRRGLRVLVHVSLADLLNLDGAAVDPDCADGAAQTGSGSPVDAQASRLAMAGTDRFGPVLVE